MQGKTAWPREHLTAAQVDMLLTDQGVERDHGLELLDESNKLVEDISEDCQPWTVRYRNADEIHGSLSVPLARELDWGTVRVRPYMTLSKDGVTGKFYAGVYVLTTPATQHGREPVLFDVTGKNLLYLLDRNVPDTYVLEPSTAQNFALDAPVSASGTQANAPLSVVTDGDTTTTTSAGYTAVSGTGPQYVQVDLGLAQTLDRIVVWHYYPDGRTYYDTKTEVSVDGVTWETVFDSSTAGTYAETSAGKTHTFSARAVRYIRDWLSGSTLNTGNHWIEIQAYRDSTLTYLQGLRQVVAAAGLTIPVRLDGTRQDAVLPKVRVWCLGDERFVDVANDLLAEIAYTDLWSNEAGEFRAQPVVPLADRPPEHRFDTADVMVDLTDGGYTEEQDQHGAYNLWRFVRSDMAYQPVEGDGLFIYPPTNRPTGADARPAPMQTVDAADQAALEAEGLRVVAADQRTERTFAGMVDPFPIAGHRDVVEFVSAGRTFKMQVTSWSLTPYAKGQWVLGGGTGGEVQERSETRTTATVTQATPLRVVVDGATTASPAKALDGATYALGERPTVIVRNPRQPLVQGKEA